MPAKERREGRSQRPADFRLLGPVEVSVDGRAIALGGEKQRALLAFFVLHANEVVSREFLIDQLWGDDAPTSAEHSIVVYVSRLRKALQVREAGKMPVLASAAGGYVLRVEPDQVDVHRFERGLELGGRALAEGALRDAADALRSACAEWRGEPLSDLVSAPFVEAASWRLAELRLAALQSRIDADLALGRHAELVGELESLVRTNPLNERLSAQLMVALYRSGRQARALEVYRTTMRSLVDELGIEPSEELQRLEQAILRHDPELEVPLVGSGGRASPQSPAGAPVSPIRQQRKTVSVLVARITPVAEAEGADPEMLRLAMARYAGAMKAAIERHGGHVERFAGDGTLGIFGVPMVHEDDALRAVRAAADMRDAVGSLTTALAREGGVTHELRVGVDTGQVLTGTGESPVTGEAVRVASELGQVAQAGEILLGQETARLLAPMLTAEPHAPVPVRGRTNPVKVFRLQRLAASAPELGRPLLDFAFVGRTEQLTALRLAFEQAVAERGARLVTVVGEPGIGKTRLLSEFTSGLRDEARVLAGRCLPYGDGITYWPLVGILRELGGPDALADRLASDEQGQRVRELILGAIGAGSQMGSVDEAQWAVRRLFEALGREKSLVVVLDDLHWAEPAFLQLVEYLASCSSGAPILILAAARDELLESRPAWALPQPNAQILPLRALSEPEAQALIDQATARSGLSESRRAQITDAAAGNPLFLEQLLAHQVEHGSATEELVLPPTIEALLAARLDQLPTPERDLLECAAIEGVVFHRAPVSGLLPEDEQAETGAHLLNAIRRNLVRPYPADMAGDDGFRFVHVLVRDAVYGSMPKELRAQLHERFAEWLEAHGTTLLEQDELVGYHLEQAHWYRLGLGMPVDDELAASARRRLTAAGRRAHLRQDYGAAAGLLERAAALVSPGQVDIRLEMSLLDALFMGRKGQKAIRRADEVAERAEAAGDRVGELLARIQQATVRDWLEGATEPLEALLEQSMPVFEAARDDFALYVAFHALGALADGLGQHDRSADANDRAAEHAERGGVADRLVHWRCAGRILGTTPVSEFLRWQEALDERELRTPWVRGCRAWALAMVGRFDEARALLAEMNAGAERGMAIALIRGQCEVGVELLAGDPAAAVAIGEESCRMLEELGQGSFLALCGSRLATAYYELGRLDKADAWARRVPTIGATRNRVPGPMIARQVRAKVLARQGQHAEAERLAREARAISDRVEGLNYQADCYADLAEVLSIAGDRQRAAEALEQALVRYQRKENLVMADRVRARLDVLQEAAQA